ncbi:MAG: dihydrofolate reductase family protein [Inquilinus limosus]|uniref:Dihydrofolate reductase family protein n=1 Tax=Inquilinus limosus TaxID=171674 RepID=A0A952FTM0_9PROT|nr:dihydrofolate reductase family protein [Inquilinus limosus]
MRKVIVTEFISADGIAEVERLTGVPWNAEMDRFKNDELADSGAMLLGRTTYQIFAGSWPSETGDFADRFNALPKYVASTTLQDLDWKPAELLQGELPDAVRALKQGEGGNIYVHGSISVAQELLRHGLVDRIRFLGYPVALGQGKPFFAPGEQHRLELISAARFSNGILAVEYAPVGGLSPSAPAG